MSKRLYFNAPHELRVHQSPGLWLHPDSQMDRYTDLDTRTDLASYPRQVRRALPGRRDRRYDVFRGNREAALRGAVQVPVNDPSLVIPAMATVTEHLGFAYTSSVLQCHPFAFARQISTLDHLTKGRIAWNIVASYLESSARNFGQGGLLDHDERYDFADEYVEVCYKLWESSWEDDAVVKIERGESYADPAKVHDVHHDGKHFKVDGCHLAEPPPQRTPVLYQAGSSPRGDSSPHGTPSACL
jgi:FMN-dependent oxidoreductase (nitrilotriacetate monooxygenase family)